jgi:hypothetical protein
MSPRLGGHIILIIFLGAAVTCDWNRDHRALRIQVGRRCFRWFRHATTSEDFLPMLGGYRSGCD